MHESELSDEVREQWVGYNIGVTPLSSYRADQPTMICGVGRGGTTALARCFARSPEVKFVTDDPPQARGGNLEIVTINIAIGSGDGKSLEDFKSNTRENYAKNFFFKNPSFEIQRRMHVSLHRAWSGANIIVMTRDPHAVAARELSTQNDDRTVDEHVNSAAARCASSLAGAVECAADMGVLLVSYEKLITVTDDVVAQINAWTAFDFINAKVAKNVVNPNNDYYIRSVTLGKIMHGKRR